MLATQWTLARTLQKYGISGHALAKTSGLSKNTVYDIINSKTQAIHLETLDKLLAGLEQLTGHRIPLQEILERTEPHDPYAHLFVNAQPYDSKVAEQHLTQWTPQELAEDECYWNEQEANKNIDAAKREQRYQQFLDIMGKSADDDTDLQTKSL